MDKNQESAILSELQEIRSALHELLESFNNFSTEGLPLRAQVPTSELVAAAVMAGALISKDTARINANDLTQRLHMAQTLATDLIRHFDAYQHYIQRQQLESMAQP